MKKSLQNGTSTSLCHPMTVCRHDRSISEPINTFRYVKIAPDPSTIFPHTALDDAYISEGTKQPAPTTLNSGRQLLDPKNFLAAQNGSQKSSKQARPRAEAPTAQLLEPDRPAIARPDPVAEAEHGLANYIERLHGVSDRTERPAKRQKVQDEDEHKKKAQDIAIRGGGDLGEYVKEKRKEGMQEAIANGIVDLTERKYLAESSWLPSLILHSQRRR